MDIKERKITKFRSAFASVVLLAIVFSATFSFYTYKKASNDYNLEVENSNIVLVYNSSAELQTKFYAAELTKEDRTIDDNYYGYLESDDVTTSLSLNSGTSGVKATCGYEIWYEPSDEYNVSYDDSLKHLTIVGNVTASNASTSKNFEYDISNISEATKIYDGYITAESGSQSWNYALRLYNPVTKEETYDVSFAGKIKLKEKGCSVATISANENSIDVQVGDTKTVKFVNKSSNDITVSSSDETIATASLISKNKVSIARVSSGDAVITIEDGNGGYDAITVNSEVSLSVKNIMATNNNFNYDISGSCSNNGTVTYNNKTNKLEINVSSADSSKQVTCNADYDYKVYDESKLLNTYVQSLVSTTSSQTDWKVVNLNGYRYIGANPNNYVWFNNELWQIIGVFGENSHGQANRMLTKLIKADILGNYAYNNVLTNNEYYTTTIYDLLNNYYYNGINGNNADSCLTAALTTNTFYKGLCNFDINGITDSVSRNMIENVVWYQYTYSNDSLFYTDDAVYNYESKNGNSNNNCTSTGNVGLMYLSDYAYADICSEDSNNTIMGAINYSTYCSNWLYVDSDQMTLFSALNYRWVIKDSGRPVNSYKGTYNSDNIRPVVYVSEKTYILSGTGTIDDPYILALNN